MDYHQMRNLRETNPTIRLLNADNSPLIISFLFQAFKYSNKITISNDELVSQLTDTIYHIRSMYGDGLYPESPQNYLDRWTTDGFLRKYYPDTSDEPCFELTPSTEKALEWIKELESREFVGTESRMLKIIELLREIAYKNSEDPNRRLSELERKKTEIEAEIEKLKSGILDRYSNTQIKERYYEISDTSTKLLSDFKQIEYNFRELDQEVRKKQILQEVQKGELLDNFFESHDIFLNSDQGRSFRAFWDLLLSPASQNEFDDLIETVIHLPQVEEINKDDTLEGLKHHLIEAGSRVNTTKHNLNEQLRKFLDDRIYLENKMIVETIKDIKTTAVQIKNNPPGNKDFITIPGNPQISMIMERPLWDVSVSPGITVKVIEEGPSDLVNTERLYSQFDIDREELQARINQLLQSHSQVTLRAVVEQYPVERGLAEILVYVDIALKNKKAFVNEEIYETVILWNKFSDKHFKIQIPQIVICGET